MASDDTGAAMCKKRKQYVPPNRQVKVKGSYPLRPGVEGFFITCDGRRERQASHEAINVVDSFFEELVDRLDSLSNPAESASKPLNTQITFKYSVSSGSEDENDSDADEVAEKKPIVNSENNDSAFYEKSESEIGHGEKSKRLEAGGVEDKTNGASEPSKRQCTENDSSKCSIPETKEKKSIDKLIEDEIRELGDKSKRRFASLDSGCNGVIFVQMRRQPGDPGPKEIVQHIMTSAASTRKHMSRFMLRILPVELACYASEEEISKAIESLVSQHFPAETESPLKFAVLYDARANTGIDRMKIINSVAKSIHGPHKVDLKNLDKNIVVQIVKTTCLIGVVEKYKELAKYNLQQLTSQKT